jgi:hypothetical protein
MADVRNDALVVCEKVVPLKHDRRRGLRRVDGSSCRLIGEHCESGSWHVILSVRSAVIVARVVARRSITSTATSITPKRTFAVCALRATRHGPVGSGWLRKRPSVRSGIDHRRSTRAVSEGDPR